MSIWDVKEVLHNRDHLTANSMVVGKFNVVGTRLKEAEFPLGINITRFFAIEENQEVCL